MTEHSNDPADIHGAPDASSGPVPVLAVLSCLVLLTQLETAVWLRGGVVLAVGVLLHVVGRRGGRRAPAADRAVARRG